MGRCLRVTYGLWRASEEHDLAVPFNFAQCKIGTLENSFKWRQENMTDAKKILVTLFLLIFAGTGLGSLVDISVATDKSSYQLGEYVTVSITAYNPNPQPVVLNGGYYFTSYLIDGVYDWAEGRSAPQVMQQVTIDSYDSVTWDMVHGFYEMQAYPLSVGTHAVVGEIIAAELIGNNASSPVQFEVIPEPTTLVILGSALPLLRAFARRRG
jgi:hypothetical protein